MWKPLSAFIVSMIKTALVLGRTGAFFCTMLFLKCAVLRVVFLKLRLFYDMSRY